MFVPRGAFSQPVIEIRLLEGGKPEAEWVKQKIEIKTEYSFPGEIYCHYNRTEDSLDSLDVTFDPKFEDLARVVSIVLLSHMEDLFSLMKG
ncbi:hypothetical protein DES53_102423 [Roseimicrobium gellanilyticum]|uniref:Uncharacterized protein n=1 Tax=Roseimicrobium gellanilyticum TaxID=748857 RepID=A0A366HTL1_9BACT|nr:hypothetical protein [Roseimicrobium gellanilyticum]RBP46037.1 hypothetical protein DES53_102423 [Roseimicrobium gellanilyticum]